MAHFAQLDDNNVVINVIVIANEDTSDSEGNEVESVGISLCKSLLGGSDTNWKQTSYNANMRGNYAGIGYTYMQDVATLGVGATDIFIEQQPYSSWSIGISTAKWYAPIPEPALTDEQDAAGMYYEWDESAYQADNTTGWVLRSLT